MTDELDGFIARHSDADNWAVLLPAILDNLSFHPSHSPNHSSNPIGADNTNPSTVSNTSVGGEDASLDSVIEDTLVTEDTNRSASKLT
jgi:hypothetical protein